MTRRCGAGKPREGGGTSSGHLQTQCTLVSRAIRRLETALAHPHSSISYPMGKFFDEIPSGEIQDWILEQKIFWVASAPLDPAGHVNASPKGRESFNLVDGKACWYTDMTGSVGVPFRVPSKATTSRPECHSGSRHADAPLCRLANGT